jgi:DNA-binding SARP family transcriptional activator
MSHARWIAEVEFAATLLVAGDATRARECVERAVVSPDLAGANSHLLRAALVLAECQRLDGHSGDAVATLVSQSTYILSGNGNYQAAMYIRAFPGLLGVLAAAVGAERMPLHLLRMILPENAAKALPMAREVLSDDEWHILAARLLGEDQADKLESDLGVLPQCRVRVFGGLEVVTDDGPVDDSAWRKRKARLLFAMLVVRKGKDVPRDQLLEYLWPEMDTERARANFYVVWNNMKRALAPNLEKGRPCPYARASGGVCRIDDLLVSTDLDDFEQCLIESRKAHSAGDQREMLRVADRLVEIYRGDLLPGDIYDDWFAPLRERCRQEFGDAMLRVGAILEECADHGGSLRMVRAALAYDPWREDLYQAALRCQIASGQRGAAIDTYMTCMHRLSEDLGIDPWAETRRLYDQVLSMEDGPAGGVYGG